MMKPQEAPLCQSVPHPSVPDEVWEALRAHTTHAGDLTAIARSADNRGRYPHAEALYREAAATGDPDALRELAGWLRALAGWLRERPELEADAEATFREAAAAGDPYALHALAEWLREQGREATPRRRSGRRPPPATRTRCAS